MPNLLCFEKHFATSIHLREARPGQKQVTYHPILARTAKKQNKTKKHTHDSLDQHEVNCVLKLVI